MLGRLSVTEAIPEVKFLRLVRKEHLDVSMTHINGGLEYPSSSIIDHWFSPTDLTPDSYGERILMA